MSTLFIVIIYLRKYICASTSFRLRSRIGLKDGRRTGENVGICRSPVGEFPLNEPTYLRVKRAIIGDLVSGQFTPGMHLTIDALTSRYGVSHMPIREALRQLEGEGILISIVHRGFRIEAITEAYIRNIYDIRVGIESMLAHRAVEKATDDDISTAAPNA